MNHPDFSHVADAVNLSLDQLNTDTLKSQMRGPYILSVVLPNGLLGAFSLMLAAFVSTHRYLSSFLGDNPCSRCDYAFSFKTV